VGRLARALPQVVEALAALHARGIVHRDLKPSNVLVAADGTVKLLDFGILAETDARRGPAGGEVVGTAGYMAPEQIAGEPVGPAADLYALGCILFELLAGRPVFEGSPSVVMALHAEAAAPDLAALAPGVPAPLAAACRALLARRPLDRPALADLDALLLAPLGARPALFLPPRPRVPALVGRGEITAALEGLLARLPSGGGFLAALVGPSGAGKSALAATLAGTAERRGATVLAGRGRPSEHVPYNALDGAVDALALALSRGGSRSPSPAAIRAARLAARAFPVLGALAGAEGEPEGAGASPAGARRSARLPRPAPPAGGAESAHLSGATRAALFDAVATLLEEAARGGGALLLVDDLQWADDDALALLDRLADRAPAGLGLVATLRDDVVPGAAHEWLARREGSGLSRIEVPPLAAGELREIVARAAREAGDSRDGAVDEAAVARAAEACAGRPFLAEVAGRALARALRAGADPAAETARIGDSRESAGTRGALATAVEAAIAEAGGAPARPLLALLVAADGWKAEAELAALLGRPRGAVEDALRALERGGIVRRAGGSGGAPGADLYHDAVRAALLEALSGEERRLAHRALAARIAADPDAPPHALVRHLLGAGDPAGAARHARRAARAAEGQRACALAAEMWGVALAGVEAAEAEEGAAGAGAGGRAAAEGGAALAAARLAERRVLLAARAEALVRAGRYAAAAEAWRALAEASAGPAAGDAILREAHALLAAGRPAEGHRRLDEGLRALGEPPLGGGLLTGLLEGARFLLGPIGRPRAVEVAPAARGGDSSLQPHGVPPDAAPHAPPAPAAGPGPETDLAVGDPADRDVRVGLMAGYFDPLAGIRLLSRARRAFDRTGRARAAAWCEYIFAYMSLFATPRRGRIRLAERWAASAAARIAGARLEAVDMLAVFPGFLRAIDVLREGRWTEGGALLDDAIAALERGGGQGTFLHLLVEVHRAEVPFFAEDVGESARALARLRSVVRDADASAIGGHVETLEVLLRLYEGRHEEAARLARAADARFAGGPLVIQGFFARMLPPATTALVGGPADIAAARAQVEEAVRSFRRLRPLSNMFAGAFAAFAALVEAAALRTGDRAASFARVRRLAAIAGRAPPFLATGGQRALAYAWDARGRPSRALEALDRAEREALSFGQRIGAAIARHQRGLRKGGAEGAALTASARALALEAGASPRVLEEDAGRRLQGA
jgi:hypothetical protein